MFGIGRGLLKVSSMSYVLNQYENTTSTSGKLLKRLQTLLDCFCSAKMAASSKVTKYKIWRQI